MIFFCVDISPYLLSITNKILYKFSLFLILDLIMLVEIKTFLKEFFEKDFKMNYLYYIWKRNNWRLDFRRHLIKYDKIEINSPIFLIGNQGSGLTLVSRMLRRHESVVNVTGNHKYWVGGDEMQSVYEPILDPKLCGYFLNAPKHSLFTPPRSWSYATEDLIDEYRATENDFTEELSVKLRKAIKYALWRHGRKIKDPRFIDKSQYFSLKIPLIYEILKDTNPYFIWISRNPYISIVRAASGAAADMERYASKIDFDERVNYCTQHWKNVYLTIKKDKELVPNFAHFMFEDIVKDPKQYIKEICNFVNLPYQDNLTPQKNDTIPFGVRNKTKWYPLRPDVNMQYTKLLTESRIEFLKEEIGSYVSELGYPTDYKSYKHE